MQNVDTIEIAADLETPVSAFLKLKPLHPFFLLESVELNEQIGRYSFLGLQPHRSFLLHPDQPVEDYFVQLENTLRLFREMPALRDAPVLAGYHSYQLSALLHPKLRIKETKIPVAAFFVPSVVLVFDHLKRTIRILCPGNNSSIQHVKQEIDRCFQSSYDLPAKGRSSEPQTTVSRDTFCDMVHRAKKLIASGDIYQVVLSAEFTGKSDADPFQMYRALRMINPSPYMFYFRVSEDYCFLGSSPELLLRNKGPQLILRPIAGTRPRKEDPVAEAALERELAADPKERAEHLMLLDLARNDIGQLSAPGTVRVSTFQQIEKFSHVMHLVSTVESQAKASLKLMDYFRAAFPAGTVTGAPKIRAMQVIHEMETHCRNLYAGSVGYFTPAGDVNHCIAIRSVECANGHYSFTAGAGIVADSDPENEYREVLSKSMAMRQMLKRVEQSL